MPEASGSLQLIQEKNLALIRMLRKPEIHDELEIVCLNWSKFIKHTVMGWHSNVPPWLHGFGMVLWWLCALFEHPVHARWLKQDLIVIKYDLIIFDSHMAYGWWIIASANIEVREPMIYGHVHTLQTPTHYSLQPSCFGRGNRIPPHIRSTAMHVLLQCQTASKPSSVKVSTFRWHAV